MRGFDGHTLFVKNRDISAAVVENVFDRSTSKVAVEVLVSPTADPAKVHLAITSLQKQIPTIPGCQVRPSPRSAFPGACDSQGGG